MILTKYFETYRKKLEYRLENPCYWVGVLTFFPELDERLFGLARKEVTLLSGTAGAGKSAFALYLTWRNYFEGVLSDKQSIVYVSAEMNIDNCISRILSQMTGIPGWRLRTGILDGVKIYDVKGGDVVEIEITENKARELIFDSLTCLSEWPIEIVDYSSPSTIDIEVEIKKLWNAGLDVPLVIVDHFGRLTDVSPEEGGALTHQHKMSRLDFLARQYNTHVLAIHELTMSALRSKGAPTEHDLKGGASSNYDPHNIIILHSPDRDSENLELDIIDVEIHLRKNKNGGGPGFGGIVPFALKAGFYGVPYDQYPHTVQRYRGYVAEYVNPDLGSGIVHEDW